MAIDAAGLRSTRTCDFDDAVSIMRGAFGSGDLIRDPDSEVELVLRSIPLEELTATRWSLTGARAGSRGDEKPEPVYLTGMLLGGAVRMWTRWEDIDTERPFLYPDPVDAEITNPDVANLALSRTAVQERARAITGVDDFELRFTGTAPIDATMDRVWRDTMAYTARTAEALVEKADAAIAHAELVDLVATLLLRTYPNTTLDAVNQRDVTGPRGAALRRALRFMDDNIAAPISIGDIAEAARLSPRGLYAAFRRDLGTTPMHHLREARLSAVRDALREADPGAATVAAIAERWGFVDPAAFGARYRTRFGEDPGRTLTR